MAEEKEKTDGGSEEQGQKPTFRSPRSLSLMAIILGVLFEILFDGHPTGISFPIWITACLLALVGMAQNEGIQPAKPEYLLSIPIVVLSGFTCLRQEPDTGILSMFITILIFAVWIFSLLECLFGWGPVAAAAVRQTIGARATKNKLIAILRGLLLALPVFFLFLALLASADLVFADYVRKAFQWLDLDRLIQILRRLFIILFATALSLGALVMALRKREENIAGHAQKSSSQILGIIEGAVVLIVIDLLFGAFVAIQFAYLFGGEANITAAGYNYSEYARRGFFELTVLAVLSLGFIIGLSRWTKRESTSEKNWFTALSTCLVALMGVILASAVKRLLLYENAYGFTRLRTYTHVAIAWMGVMFAVFLVLLYRERLRRFAPVAALGVLGFTLTLNVLNVDAFIVRQNIKRYTDRENTEIVREGITRVGAGSAELDLHYLFDLSYDGVPGLVDFADAAQGEIRTELLSQLACERGKLNARMESLKWPSLHFSRLGAQKALDGIANLLDEYPVTHSRTDWVVEVNGEYEACYRDFDWD
ncbi:MAG: DUF4173 domain-containing protein [Anaerolineales bacterium]